jgi:hypothetical protein
LVVAADGQRARPGDKSVDPPAKSTGEERNKVFQWFNTLGFLDVKDRKFVRVATGHWHQHGDDPPRNTYERGFLLKEKGDSFTVWTLSLTEETYEKTPVGTPGHEQVSYEGSELKTGAAAYLKAIRTPADDEERPGWLSGEIRLHPRTEMFVLAWACWRNAVA